MGDLQDCVQSYFSLLLIVYLKTIIFIALGGSHTGIFTLLEVLKLKKIALETFFPSLKSALLHYMIK